MIKKIFLVSFVILLLIFITFSNQTPLFKDYSDNFEIYTKSPSSNAQIVCTNSKTYPLIFGKVGESCKIFGEFDLSSFLMKMGAKTVFTEKAEHGVSYYAYSNDIKYKASVNGHVVNLHVFIGDSGVTVGSPIIFGSF